MKNYQPKWSWRRSVIKMQFLNSNTVILPRERDIYLFIFFFGGGGGRDSVIGGVCH